MGASAAEAAEAETKACTQCGEVKPLEAFGWSNAGRSRQRRPRLSCKACRVAAEKVRYRKDPRPNKARAAAWYLANRAQAIANSKRSAESNPDRTRAFKKKWEVKNPNKRRAQVQLYRARKRGGEVEKFTDREIFDRDHWVCGICEEDIDRSLSHPHPRSVSLDHIVPVAKGGGHTRANVRAAHLRCNQVKSDKQMDNGEEAILTA